MNIKSHLTFSKKQRNGIFLLLLIIITLQCVYYFVDFSSPVNVDEDKLTKFTKEIDSLKLVELEKSKPKFYPFNPNYITDFKGASLGMTNEEIDRLLAFRKQNKWINSAEQFQEITKVHDTLLNKIAPYFKFPDWVNKPKVSKGYLDYKQSKTINQKIDLNIATAQQLQEINGVGKILSDRIVKFRNRFDGGFIADIQLEDVYGLEPEMVERITKAFTVKSPRVIKKIILNSAAVEQLVTIQHIDYDLAHNIIEQRQLREGFKTLDELIKVKDFPINKIDIIKLYLSLD